MASVIRYPRSKYWFAAFRDSRGRQHRRTTRETDKRRAQRVADQFERIAQRKGNPQRVRQIFAEFYREHYAEDLPAATWKNGWPPVSRNWQGRPMRDIKRPSKSSSNSWPRMPTAI